VRGPREGGEGGPREGGGEGAKGGWGRGSQGRAGRGRQSPRGWGEGGKIVANTTLKVREAQLQTLKKVECCKCNRGMEMSAVEGIGDKMVWPRD
jgi:hypothetical protein